jgi:integrating conjugative element membrane protein, PFL_4702 family
MYIGKSIKKIASWFSGIMLAVYGTAVSAALPTVEDPTRGQGSGIFETMQNYSYDAFVFGGLLIAALGFTAVAWHGVHVFSEVQNQKKKWSDFGAVVAVGILLLVVIIWLLTKAADIL